MEPQFTSLAELWAMDGHGPYVWACYGLVAAVLVYLIAAPRRRHRNYLRQQRRVKIANEQMHTPNPVIEK